MIEYISEYKDKMNKENDGGDLSWVNRFINRWAGGDSWTSCDSLVVEWSVAIASTRVQFPVTAFLYPPLFATFTTHLIDIAIEYIIVRNECITLICCCEPPSSSCSSFIKYAFGSTKPVPHELPPPAAQGSPCSLSCCQTPLPPAGSPGTSLSASLSCPGYSQGPPARDCWPSSWTSAHQVTQ